MSAHYKRVHFTYPIKGNSLNEVAYVVYSGRQIVFTGLHNCNEGPAGSTINYAEDIIFAIAKKENIDPQSVTFFDLQTTKGYMGYEPGDYCLNKLGPKWENGKIVFMGWQEGHCTDTIFRDFGGYIRGSDSSIPFRNTAQAHGAINPIPENHSLNAIQDVIDLMIEVEIICEKNKMNVIWENFLDRICPIAKAICKEQNISTNDTASFHALPKTTPLGNDSSELFCKTCDWLVGQHKEFGETITQVLFIS